MGRAERARRERQSRRLSFRPRRPAGPATPSSPSFVRRLPRTAAGLLLAFAALLALPLQAQAQTVTNTAAMGQPSISGTAQVGQTLTASTSGIMDADLLPASFTYQWVRVGADGTSNETNIGSNLSTYTPSSSDVGNRIRVKVSFTDGAGNLEGPLPSDAYPSEPPGATVVAAQGSCPSDNDWCATLTMGYDSSSSSLSHTYSFGFISGSNFGVLAPAMFTRGPTAYTVTEVYRSLNTTANGNTILTDSLNLTVSGGTLPDGTVLNVGGTEFTVGTDTATSTAGRETWNLKALGISFAWVEGQKVSVSLKFPTPPVLQSAYTGFFEGTLCVSFSNSTRTLTSPMVGCLPYRPSPSSRPATPCRSQTSRLPGTAVSGSISPIRLLFFFAQVSKLP